jgi:hypothetical protein
MLVAALVGIEGGRWAEYNHGKQLTQTGLKNLLKGYRRPDDIVICPDRVSIGLERKRGYEVAWFSDVFARYLSTGQNPGIEVSKCPEAHGHSDNSQNQSVQQDAAWTLQKCEKPNNDGVLDTWTLRGGENGPLDKMDEPGTVPAPPVVPTPRSELPPDIDDFDDPFDFDAPQPVSDVVRTGYDVLGGVAGLDIPCDHCGAWGLILRVKPRNAEPGAKTVNLHDRCATKLYGPREGGQ